MRGYDPGAVGLFILLHAAVVAVWWYPPTPRLWGWLAASYLVRMFGVTAGYHRYFSHRSYRLGRAGQFCMAFLAETSGQKGVLWWAAHHRDHHRHSDREQDIHSPWQRSFWWAHVGWVLSNQYDRYERRKVADMARYPELRWLDRYHLVPPLAFAAATAWAGGAGALVWGFVLATVLLYHGTFAINSFAHVYGTRRFDTPDQSRNNWVLALVTLGEGWHNNHHHSMSSCRHSDRWWEIDPTWWGLRLLEWCGVAGGLRPFRPRGQARAA